MRVTSVELHQKLGETIDKARIEPVTVTKHDRDHVVILSAEEYAVLQRTARRARRTGGLTKEERALAASAALPSGIARKRYLAELAQAVENQEMKQAGRSKD